ncbi:MAG: hypothetical protein SWE60_23915, partial [Thermodesulfobacteriota bacterium]|nr:hypothetical protein [Thermodesulfobacteriota bacterium]
PDSVKKRYHVMVKAGKSIMAWGAEKVARVGKGPWEKTKKLFCFLVGEAAPHLLDSMKKGSSCVVKKAKALFHCWTKAFGRVSRGAGETGEETSRAGKETTVCHPPGERPGEMKGKRMSPVKGMGRRAVRGPTRGGSTIEGIGGIGGPGRVRPPSRVRGVDRI